MKGLCVVKKLIQLITKSEMKVRLRDSLAENAMALVHNAYGNYAVQTALEVLKIIIADKKIN